MLHPSGAAFSCFRDELTAQRKLLVISALHRPLYPRQTVLCLIKVIRSLGANLFVDREQMNQRVDCTLPIKCCSVVSRPAA